MNSLSFILGFNNHILYFLSRSPPVFCDVTLSFTYFRRLFHGLFKTLQKNDFSSWSYRPYNEILLFKQGYDTLWSFFRLSAVDADTSWSVRYCPSEPKSILHPPQCAIWQSYSNLKLTRNSLPSKIYLSCWITANFGMLCCMSCNISWQSEFIHWLYLTFLFCRNCIVNILVAIYRIGVYYVSKNSMSVWKSAEPWKVFTLSNIKKCFKIQNLDI